MTFVIEYPSGGQCTICGVTDVFECRCNAQPMKKPDGTFIRNDWGIILIPWKPKKKFKDADEQAKWWQESWSLPMLRKVIENSQHKKRIEINLVTHGLRHLEGYPEDMADELFIPLLPTYTNFKDEKGFMDVVQSLVAFLGHLAAEIIQHSDVDEICVTHFVQSQIRGVQAYDTALTFCLIDRYEDFDSSWCFMDRHFDPKKGYLQPHYSTAEIIRKLVQKR